MEFLSKSMKTDKLMLVNMLYTYGNKSNNYTDILYIVYRDLRTGEKKLKTISKPEIEIYFTKEEYRDYDYNKVYIELEKTYKVQCPIRNVVWTIANEAGPSYKSTLKSLVETGNRKDMSLINKYPYVFGSDLDCESYYRVYWLQNYDNELIKPLTKAYFDIEVDTINIAGFPNMGECPINVISLVDETTESVYVYMLNNPDNPQIAEFIDNINDVINEWHDMFDDMYGKLKYNTYIFDDERKLIRAFFDTVNILKPDFLMGWNIFGFDIPYIIERCKVLGMDPSEVMTHPDFTTKVCKFTEDKLNFDVKDKSDRLELSSYTKYIDHMRLYAATRKGRTELGSYSLNHVGKIEIGDEKIDYSEEANIKTFPYVNYKLFITYNIKDVLLEKGIENKTSDLESLYVRSYMNCTAYDKVFKQTFMLRRRVFYEYLCENCIQGNNVNVYNTEKYAFPGAVVANPLLNNHTGVSLFGAPSMFIFDDCIDFDFSAMYPNTMVAFNIERNTMIGKLTIPEFTTETYDHIYTDDGVYSYLGDSDDEEDEDEEVTEVYDAGKDFIESYLSGDILSIGSRWFNLPSYDKIHEDFKNKFNPKPRKKMRITKLIDKFKDMVHIILGDD